MRWMIMMVLAVTVLLSACTSGSNPDSMVDEELGLVREESQESFDSAVEDMKKMRYEEGTQNLQRQASEL